MLLCLLEMISTKPVKIISARPLGMGEYIKELVQYRHLIWVFAIQELKVQYVQTRLNFIWALLRPLMVLALFTFIFSRVITIRNQNYPYPLFAFTGLMVWNNFGFLVTNAGTTIVNQQQLIKKMYFPRLILIFSKLLVSMVELGISFALTIVLMFALGYPPGERIVFVPFFLVISILVGLTVAIWLSALTIRYRDLNQFVPTLIGFLIWLTPVFYPVTLVPAQYSFILYLNPISAAIQGCRWAILGDVMPSIYYLPAILASFVFFVAGLFVFIRSESDLADYI